MIVERGDLPNLALKCCNAILAYFSFSQIHNWVLSIRSKKYYFNAYVFSQHFFFEKMNLTKYNK